MGRILDVAAMCVCVCVCVCLCVSVCACSCAHVFVCTLIHTLQPECLWTSVYDDETALTCDPNFGNSHVFETFLVPQDVSINVKCDNQQFVLEFCPACEVLFNFLITEGV